MIANLAPSNKSGHASHTKDWENFADRDYGGALMGTFDTNRENFDLIIEAYLNYVALYKLINNGSIKDVTPFETFYWRFTYHDRYQDPSRISALGY